MTTHKILKTLLCASLIINFQLSVFNSAQAQWYTGTSQKFGLTLCFHITDTAVSFYSPMQTTDPIPVSKWSLNDNNLVIECKSIGLKVNVTRHDDTYSGYWKQSIFKEDITFYPTDTLFTMRRPQTPQPPYRFDEETIIADYTDSQGNPVHLEGTLTIPRNNISEGGQGGVITYPTLVLVSGSGQQNRDEELLQHKPFLVLADYLASRGIAVLRYDDRGVGASSGEVDNGDTRLFAEDAEAMFKALKGNPHVDPSRLGIGGHSEGGAIAPMVAAHNNDVKFVVMLAGQGCTGFDVMMQQNEAIYRVTGVSERLLTIHMDCVSELFKMPSGRKAKEYLSVIERHTAGLTKAEADSIGLAKSVAGHMKQQLDSRWMQSFLALDPADYLPKVKCPVLALNGDKDLQVLALPNQKRIKELCPHADCRMLPDLNHLFQHCTTGSPNEYMLIEETFSPEAMQAIADWILKQ